MQEKRNKPKRRSMKKLRQEMREYKKHNNRLWSDPAYRREFLAPFLDALEAGKPRERTIMRELKFIIKNNIYLDFPTGQADNTNSEEHNTQHAKGKGQWM